MENASGSSNGFPRTQSGETLEQLSHQRPTLVVFLRHSGCPFCREMLAQIARDRGSIERGGAQIAIVHMMPESEAAPFMRGFRVNDLPRISDPDQVLYREFALPRGSFSQVMGPRVWWQGFKTTVLKRHWPGVPSGDVFQLPGAFLLVDGKVVRAKRFGTSADRVDLTEFGSCPVGTGNADASIPAE